MQEALRKVCSVPVNKCFIPSSTLYLSQVIIQVSKVPAPRSRRSHRISEEQRVPNLGSGF